MKKRELTELKSKACLSSRRIKGNINRTLAKYPQITHLESGLMNDDFIRGLITVVFYYFDDNKKVVFRVKKYKNG